MIRCLIGGLLFAYSLSVSAEAASEGANLGFSITVHDHRLSTTYGELESDSDRQFLILDTSFKNTISPELVFEHDVAEEISLNNLRVRRAFLYWNGTRVFALSEDAQAQTGHVPDSPYLRWAGDEVRGDLVFRVPNETPQNVELVVSDDQFGPVFVDVVQDSAMSETLALDADEGLTNGLIQIGVRTLESVPAGTDETVLIELTVKGGRPWRSPLQESNEAHLPIDLTGLRLYAEGEPPISPIGEPRIVALPDRPAVHRLNFVVPLDAPVLALVLPVKPPKPSSEPHWIVPVRGEAPTLKNTPLAQSGARDSSSASSRQSANPTQTESADPQTPARKPHSPQPLPNAPELKPRSPEHDLAVEARLAELRARPMPAQATVESSADPKMPTSIERNQLVATSFLANQSAHYYRLSGGDNTDQLTELLLDAAEDAGLEMSLSVLDDNQRITPNRRAVIEPLRLEGGEYLLTIRNPGRKLVDYKLTWTATGLVTDAREYEPNDRALERLLPRMANESDRKVLHGVLSGGDDVDFFVLDSPTAAMATLELRSAASTRSGQLRLHKRNGEAVLFGGQGPDRRHVMRDVYLLAGPNVFSVSQGSGDYTVQAVLQELPGPDYEREPNDTLGFAHDLLIDQMRFGRIANQRDRDLYEFVSYAETPLELIADGEAPLAIKLKQGTKQLQNFKPAAQIDEVFTVSPGVYQLEVSSPSSQTGPTYSIQLAHSDLWRDDNLTSLPLDVRFKSSRDTAAPYADRAQLIEGVLAFENTGSELQQLNLVARTTHQGVRVELPDAPVNLAPGERVEVPVDIQLRRDISSRGPIKISLGARQGDAIAVTSWLLKLPLDALPTMGQWLDLPLPDALLGGLDVAALRFRAKNPKPANARSLFQGVATRSTAFRGRTAEIELAGNEPMMLAGGVLVGQIPGEVMFTLHTSENGVDSQSIYTAQVELGFQSHVFELPRPVNARFVRAEFEPVTGSSPVAIGELKLIAASSSLALFPNGANLASTELGWHVVKARAGLLVAGFHHGRMARIQQIQTQGTSATVSVERSIESPYGPWLPLGTLDQTKVWETTETVDARYLRFSGTWSKEEKFEVVSVFEATPSKDYRSILGEWGGHDAESNNLSALESAAMTTEATGETLTADQDVSGHIWRDQGIEKNYRVEIPDGAQSIEFVLTSGSMLRADLAVTDEHDKPLNVSRQRDQQEARYKIDVGGRQSINVRVFEPLRQIAFLWDDSGSLQQFQPGLRRLLRRFSEQLDPAVETVQLTPLHRADTQATFLMDAWSGDTNTVQQALSQAGPTGSSAAYATLDAVLDEFQDTANNRILVILTDEDGDRTRYGTTIEDKLAAVAPTVFAFHAMPSAGQEGINVDHIDHMQTWAAIGGGRYRLLREPHELLDAFERVQTWLRRPSTYELSMHASTEPLTPGTLYVESGETVAEQHATPRAVEIILDASGSMLRRMPDSGQRRIEVAKAVLQNLVDSDALGDAHFALRAFGHHAAHSCRTDLEIPLGPLNKDKTQETIAGLSAVNLAKTPIAASLSAVSTDLKNTHANAVVVLVTDGEETCEGDVKAAIRRLLQLGIQVQLNVVGFAIDQSDLKAEFESWSDLGGGDYFDATDGDSLRGALSEALAPKYDVIDAAGRTVTAGRMGESIELAPGNYAVRLQATGQEQTVTIRSAERVEVRL